MANRLTAASFRTEIRFRLARRERRRIQKRKQLRRR